jgi:hypothetical protein
MDHKIEDILTTKPKTPRCPEGRPSGNCLVWTQESGIWKEYKGVKHKDRRYEVRHANK